MLPIHRFQEFIHEHESEMAVLEEHPTSLLHRLLKDATGVNFLTLPHRYCLTSWKETWRKIFLKKKIAIWAAEICKPAEDDLFICSKKTGNATNYWRQKSKISLLSFNNVIIARFKRLGCATFPAHCLLVEFLFYDAIMVSILFFVPNAKNSDILIQRSCSSYWDWVFSRVFQFVRSDRIPLRGDRSSELRNCFLHTSSQDQE